DPFEAELPRFRRGQEKAQVRIGCDSRSQARDKYRLTVVTTGEFADGVASNPPSRVVDPEAGFHRMADRDLHLGGIATVNFGGDRNARGTHHDPPRQPASVTTPSAIAACTAPPARIATATTRCEPARRTRDSTSTLSDGSGNSNCAIFGTGFFSENRAID